MKVILYINVLLISVFECCGLVFALDIARRFIITAIERGGLYVLTLLPALYFVLVAALVLLDSGSQFVAGVAAIFSDDDDSSDEGVGN